MVFMSFCHILIFIHNKTTEKYLKICNSEKRQLSKKKKSGKKCELTYRTQTCKGKFTEIYKIDLRCA